MTREDVARIMREHLKVVTMRGFVAHPTTIVGIEEAADLILSALAQPQAGGWEEGAVERAARAHFEAKRNKPGSHAFGLTNWATWEEACEIDGWRDEQVRQMQAALASLPSGGGVKMREAVVEALATYDTAIMALEFTKPRNGQVIINKDRAEALRDKLRAALTSTSGDGDEGLIAESAEAAIRWGDYWLSDGSYDLEPMHLRAIDLIYRLASRLSELTGFGKGG